MPLASTVPSAPTATANGLPGTSASAHASASSSSSKRRSTTRGSRSNAAIAGASAWQMWQPSEVKTASPKSSSPSPAKCSAERGAPADLRPLAGDLERALRARSPAAARRSRARARAGRRASTATPSSAAASPRPSHSSVVSARRSSSGSTAAATASSAARPIDARPTRPLAPKHAHGAPPRPCSSATPCAAQKTVNSAAVGPRGALGAGDQADGQAGLDRAQRGPGDARQRLAADPVGRQRRARRRGRTRASCRPRRAAPGRGRGRARRRASEAREPSA